jgi:pentatricopeptide repeat protein
VLVNAYAVRADVAGANRALERRIQCRMPPTILSYNTLMNAHVNARDKEGAEGVFETILQEVCLIKKQ